MRSRPLPLLSLLLLLACSPQPAAGPSPSASPAPASSPASAVPLRAPAADILSDQEAGFKRSAGVDHVSLARAAEEEQNQPLALTRFRSWGLVEEATRSWGDAGGGADEALLLLTREEGASAAYGYLAAEAAGAPLLAGTCPPAIRADECVEGRSSGTALIVARVGPYVFRLRVRGADPERLAVLQSARIRQP